MKFLKKISQEVCFNWGDEKVGDGLNKVQVELGDSQTCTEKRFDDDALELEVIDDDCS